MIPAWAHVEEQRKVKEAPENRYSLLERLRLLGLPTEQEEDSQLPLSINVFCPTGPGGGVDPTCRVGGGNGGDSASPPTYTTPARQLREYWEKERKVVEQGIKPLRKEEVEWKSRLTSIKDEFRDASNARKEGDPKPPHYLDNPEYREAAKKANVLATEIRQRRTVLDDRIMESLRVPEGEREGLRAFVRARDNKEKIKAEKKLTEWNNELASLSVQGSFTQSGWVTKTFRPVNVEMIPGVRSSHEDGNGSGHIFLGKLSKYSFFHEMGHELETAEGVRSAAKRFLKSRTENKKVSMSRETGDSGYGRDEVARVQKKGTKNLVAYTRKIYANGHTEIISQGLEKFMRSPSGFMKSDPEYFDLILGALRGEFKKPRS